MDAISKMELRRILLTRRHQISAVERQAAAAKAAALLLNTDIFKQSQHIACYYPFNNEFDCLPIITAIWQANKNCYLPIISSDDSAGLAFVCYQQNTLLQPNRFHIPEPASEDFFTAEKLDLVLLPLVGFDARGNRLGMGAGYYDRTFKTSKNIRQCFLLGLAYEAQEIFSIPHDEWDVSLNGVLTEKRMIFFNRNNAE